MPKTEKGTTDTERSGKPKPKGTSNGGPFRYSGGPSFYADRFRAPRPSFPDTNSHVLPWHPPRTQPLVSCIMPTKGRGCFVAQAILYFQRQHYPNTELIIVYDEDDMPQFCHAVPETVRWVSVPAGLTVGEKRNRACEAAGGSIIAHWDDDDWYGPERLCRQVNPIISGEADITALTSYPVFGVDSWQFWRMSNGLHRQIFFADVHSGSLVFAKRVWEGGAYYPNESLAEDASFLRAAIDQGAWLGRVNGDGLFIYVRHRTNTWKLDCGRHLDPSGWRSVAEPVYFSADRSFYASLNTSRF